MAIITKVRVDPRAAVVRVARRVVKRSYNYLRWQISSLSIQSYAWHTTSTTCFNLISSLYVFQLPFHYRHHSRRAFIALTPTLVVAPRRSQDQHKEQTTPSLISSNPVIISSIPSLFLVIRLKLFSLTFTWRAMSYICNGFDLWCCVHKSLSNLVRFALG